jgi:cell division protein FtsB
LVVAILLATALTLQAQLWFSADGFGKTSRLRAAVVEQQRQNDLLRERNKALDAEVFNLKERLEAAEERARTDLGMIGPKETFFQVVPVAASAD